MADSGGSPAETYIELARLGRIDGWSTAKAVARLLLYPALFIALLVIAEGAVLAFRPAWVAPLRGLVAEGGPSVELALILITFLPLTWAIRDAVVKSHRRPFLSLIGPDLRFDWRRFLVGGAIWLAAILVGVGLQALAQPLLAQPDAAADDAWSFDWSLVPVALVALLVIPIQAGTEELLCRGWLTQLLGQAIRSRIVVALLVAAFFSLLHGIGSVVSFAYFMIASLAFSAISLRDGRLELAIGAHAMQNLFVLLVSSPLADAAHRPSLLDSDPAQMPWTELPLAAAIGGLAYLLAGWLVPRLSPAAASASR